MSRPAIDPVSQFVGSTTTALEAMTKSLQLIHKRIDDHMENEEKEQKATSERLAGIEAQLIQKFAESEKRHESFEEKWRFMIWTAKWVAPVLMFLWPIAVPVLQDFLLDLIGINPDTLISLHSAIALL